MNDLLAAASLLLALVGVLYGLWYREMLEAVATKVPESKPNRAAPRRKVCAALYGRAVPLALAASALALIFLPDVLKITTSSLKNYRVNGREALDDYSAVRTAFCFVVLFASSIALHAAYLAKKLIGLAWKLRG